MTSWSPALRRLLLELLLSVPVMGFAGKAAAQQALSLTPLGSTAIRVDGDLREWRGVRFYKVGAGADGSLEYALGYDSQALYLGARVRDDQFVRSRHPSPAEDAVVLTLSMPRAAGAALATEVWLYAGVIGKQRAEAAISVSGAAPVATRAVAVAEGPLAGSSGHVLEARVPWSAIAGGAQFAVGRGAIALHDVDGKRGAAPSTMASASAKRASELPPLLVEGGANAAIATFFHDKDLSADSVRFDMVGDLAGDARLERVVLAGTFAVVAGPEMQGGSGYSYVDLPIPLASDILDAALHDRDGDGKLELVVQLRDQPEVEHVYRCDGSRLVALAPPAAVASAPARATVTRAPADQPRAPYAGVVHVAPPGATELVAAFRQARGIDPARKPRFVQHANVAEDGRLESLMLFGKDLLVIGKGYRGGTGYFYFALPVHEAADIQRVFTADVTGDGRRELFVRAKQQIGEVQREVLIGYAFNDTGVAQILAAEVRREQAGNSIGNIVKLAAARGQFTLSIAPGRAQGWDAESYPFVAESMDAYSPLLLPWKDGTARYRYDGERLVAGQ
jgi:hypothetical protein